MNYQKKRLQNRNKKIATFIFLIAIIFFGIYKINFINDVTRETSCSICKLQSWVARPFISIKNHFVFKQSLIDQISKQQETIENLQLDLLQQKISSIENKELKDSEKSIGDEEGFKIVKVISRPPYSPYDTLTLSSGSKDGLNVGQKVFTKGVFIGFVQEVSEDFSIVQMISSSNVESVVRIKNEIDATATGIGGGRLIISLPKDIDVENGDVVYLPNITSSLVGVVSTIEVADESFQIVYFNLPVSISKILFVEVMVK